MWIIVVICFIPRILVGVIAYFVFTGLMKVIKNRSVSTVIFGAINDAFKKLVKPNTKPAKAPFFQPKIIPAIITGIWTVVGVITPSGI